MNYNKFVVFDYYVFFPAKQGQGPRKYPRHTLFQPATPRAHKAFEGMPLNDLGCFVATSDDEIEVIFDKLDEDSLRPLLL